MGKHHLDRKLIYLHHPDTLGTIHAPVILLPSIGSAAVDSQDHHPAADGAHWD